MSDYPTFVFPTSLLYGGVNFWAWRLNGKGALTVLLRRCGHENGGFAYLHVFLGDVGLRRGGRVLDPRGESTRTATQPEETRRRSGGSARTHQGRANQNV